MTDVIVEDRDLGFKDIIKEIKKLDGALTDIGLFGEGGDASVNIAERAATMEYGTRSGDIPARPFERDAFDKNLGEIKSDITNEYNKILTRKGKAKKMLQRIGNNHEGRIKETITSGSFVPLKPATIVAKGSSKPLIDQGDLRRRVEHKENIR